PDVLPAPAEERLRAGLGVAALGIVAGVATGALAYAWGGAPLGLRFFRPEILVAVPVLDLLALSLATVAGLLAAAALALYLARAAGGRRGRGATAAAAARARAMPAPMPAPPPGT